MEEKEKKKLTRAQKTAATKSIIKELLAVKIMRHNELIDEAAKEYIARYGAEEGENANDVRGRVGSVLDVMKKESQVMADEGNYALKARMAMPRRGKTEVEEVKEEPVQEEPKKKTRAKKEVAPEEEKAEPKKRGRKPKAKVEAEKKEEVKEEKIEEKPIEKPVEEPVEEKKAELIVKPKAEVAQKSVVMDMSFLFGDKAAKAKVAPLAKREEKREEKNEEKPAPKAKVEVKTEKPAPKTEKKPTRARTAKAKPLTAEEKLKEEFLQRIRTLGGDYFEYYSVYLLERYSRRNGRRLESLRVCGGDHDGGIDGEIELTDTLGFKETIYIQSKNWDPGKSRTNSWVVGETLLQQFIGACAYAQAKSGKTHCRGIFMTTSHFTPDAKVILDTMSDKIVGYDGNDLFETAKECSFGIIKKNGEWVLDETLLSGEKAFFQMQ